MPDWPPITCVCPTYGRFERLRDAVACFLLQDYPGPRDLLILNDAAEPVILSERLTITADQCLVEAHVRIINARARFATLGHKRQEALERAQGPLVAHWDDDDLYLPWHLQDAAAALKRAPAAMCAKSRCGWWGLGPREAWELSGGVHHNTFEGQMVFEQDRALELGGYPPRMSGQAAHLLSMFRKAGELIEYRPADRDVSYVYRWADGLGHVSGLNGPDSGRAVRFSARNHDFGLGRDGKPQTLIPSDNPQLWARARLAGQFRILSHQLSSRLEPADWAHARDRLRQATEPEQRRAEREREKGAGPRQGGACSLPAELWPQPDMGASRTM